MTGEILFLAHRIPFPPDRGDKIRSWHVLKHLSGLARVHLACFADDAADAAHIDGLRRALGDRLGEIHVEVRRTGRAMAAARAFATGKPVSLTLFDSARMRAFVAARLADPRVAAIYAFSGQMAQFVPANARQRFIMDFVDMDSAKFEAYAKAGGLLSRVHAREAERLFAFEREVAARADASLFVSEAEAALFRGRAGAANVHALANGIDSVRFDPAAAFPRLTAGERGEEPVLLFTGQMDYRPNVDAVRWFAAEVLPRLPEARFVIAGRSATSEVKALGGDRITVTGAVRDMRSWLAAADVVVAPLRIARGIQNKVLEAMAMARPVVATPAAFEGIEAEPGRDLIVADGAEAMAREIEGLLASPDRAASLGAAGRRLVVARYGWDARLAPLDGLIFPAAAKREAA
ncbi:TIGR03087 family PEP-CTERM/XrtA system glycosyltransferase [Sphingosinicella sp. YJ22]|uniref:TIGR03087 family PEP-CTERM/XrtA system glycosyltransferase n=1 Tax=Sphingosinicella sp. YJ22 TaxID=1104780 RepID=UPI001A9C5B03|nr:TIGR03087 family PEP-CTERM/XrtA system glycosyltransferase [Sphingosinicella sp. YJ22]